MHKHRENFYILLSVRMENLQDIFFLVFNQLDAQNLFYSKFYFTPLHVSSTRAHYQEVKIALHSLCTRRPPKGVMIPEAV